MPLARQLESHGVRVFIDQLSIPDGADWDRTIDEALTRCAVVVVVLSPAAVDSRQVRAEWNMAIDEGKKVLAIVREKCSIPRQLRLLQHLDMTAERIDDELLLTRLLSAINSM